MEDIQGSLSRLMQCEMNESKTEDSSKLSAQLHGRLQMLFKGSQTDWLLKWWIDNILLQGFTIRIFFCLPCQVSSFHPDEYYINADE